MTDIQTWIDEGKALTAGTTEGPWEARMDTPTMGGEIWTLRTIGKPGIKMVVNEYQFGQGNAQFIADARTRLPQALAALQTVLDMHRPIWVDGIEYCKHCVDFGGEYPCPTVQAIQTAIKETK